MTTADPTRENRLINVSDDIILYMYASNFIELTRVRRRPRKRVGVSNEKKVKPYTYVHDNI